MSTAIEQKAAVAKFRAAFLMNASKLSMLEQQRLSARGPGVKEPFRVRKFPVLAPPEEDLRELLWKAVDDMRSPGEQMRPPTYAQCLHAEWTGIHAAEPGRPQLPQSQCDTDRSTLDDTRASCTMFYLHGGSYK